LLQKQIGFPHHSIRCKNKVIFRHIGHYFLHSCLAGPSFSKADGRLRPIRVKSPSFELNPLSILLPEIFLLKPLKI
jgi:hypothetical protein